MAREKNKLFFKSNAIRGLLSLAGGIASLWPFLAPELFNSMSLKFYYFFAVLIIGVLFTLIVAKSDDPKDGDLP